MTQPSRCETDKLSESSPKTLFEVPSAPGKVEDAGRETDDLLNEPRMSEASTSRAESSIASSPFEGWEFADITSGEYFIHIEKTKKRKSPGLDLGIVKNVGQWNRTHTMQVCTDDIIVEVNSVSGSGEALLQKMGNEVVLDLRLLRPDDFMAYEESIGGWSSPPTP